MYPEFASFWRFFCFLSSEILRKMVHLPTCTICWACSPTERVMYLGGFAWFRSSVADGIPKPVSCGVLDSVHPRRRLVSAIYPPTSPCLLSSVEETARERRRSFWITLPGTWLLRLHHSSSRRAVFTFVNVVGQLQ